MSGLDPCTFTTICCISYIVYFFASIPLHELQIGNKTNKQRGQSVHPVMLNPTLIQFVTLLPSGQAETTSAPSNQLKNTAQLPCQCVTPITPTQHHDLQYGQQPHLSILNPIMINNGHTTVYKTRVFFICLSIFCTTVDGICTLPLLNKP